jgi:glycosyltransferase involved in cell wall biosynthesis
MRPTRHRGERPRPRSVSVVVPAYNAAATIAEQLEALATQWFDGDWELVIVDNGSTDGTADLARRYCQRFKEFTLIDSAAGPPRRAARRHARSVRDVFQGERVLGGWRIVRAFSLGAAG